MPELNNNKTNTLWVAIDVAKASNDVLVELPGGTRKKIKVANRMEDYCQFIEYLKSFNAECIVGFEATADYHRTIAFHLQKAGCMVKLISSFSAARTREALHSSWDKNDPKDAQVILHLLKTGCTQLYYDPLIEKSMIRRKLRRHTTKFQCEK
jgi:transposase